MWFGQLGVRKIDPELAKYGKTQTGMSFVFSITDRGTNKYKDFSHSFLKLSHVTKDY